MESMTELHHIIKIMTKSCLIFLILLKFGTVNCQNSITGCYSSNFAVIGWFGTQIKLNEDKSFEYLFAGDLFYDKINGTYEIVKNKIVLNFPLNVDTLEIAFRDSSGNVTTHKIRKPENIAAINRPSKLKLKGNRLIIYDRIGKKVRRKMNSREKMRKYYLVKIPCE